MCCVYSNELELAETHYHEFCERIAAAHEKLKSNEESRRLLEASARAAADEELNAKKRVRLAARANHLLVHHTRALHLLLDVLHLMYGVHVLSSGCRCAR